MDVLKMFMPRPPKIAFLIRAAYHMPAFGIGCFDGCAADLSWKRVIQRRVYKKSGGKLNFRDILKHEGGLYDRRNQ
jgi:hypothetical protein